MKLSSQERIVKEAWYISGKYIKVLRDKNSSNSAELIRERKTGTGELVTCISCKAFISKRLYYKHKKFCSQSSVTKLPPDFIEAFILSDLKKQRRICQI